MVTVDLILKSIIEKRMEGKEQREPCVFRSIFLTAMAYSKKTLSLDCISCIHKTAEKPGLPLSAD